MRWLAGVLILLLLGGGLYYYLRADPLRAALDRRWPPETADQQRQAAIDSATAALKILSAPNLAVGADVPTIQAIAFDEVKAKGVTKLALATDRQLLRLTADFDITLEPEDLPPGSAKRALVAKLTPRVAGQVDLFLGVAAALATYPRRVFQIKLLPAVHGVRIDKITVAGSYDVSATADVIALLLNQYADNLGAAIAANPLLNVTLPTTLQNKFDPSGPINLNLKQAPDLRLALSGRPFTSPVGLGAAAWLIDGNKLGAIMQLAPLDKPPAQPNPAPGTFEDIKAIFKKRLADGMGISDPPEGVWVAVGKALLARSLNSAFLQAQPCLTGSGSIPKENFLLKFPIPGLSIDCTPHKNCTPTKTCDLQVDTRDCRRRRNCTHNRDTRDCSACLLRGPRLCAFGSCTGTRCIKSGNDPFCEAAKAAHNAAYDTAFNACHALGAIDDAVCETEKGAKNRLYAIAKAKCETDKEADRIACEVTQNATCEAAKGVLEGLNRTGSLANIDGSVSGAGNLKLCFRDVRFADAMDKLTLTLEASGSAALDTHFKFVPLDVAGHVVCPLAWTVDKRLKTTVPPQSTSASLSLTERADSGTVAYEGRFDALPVKLHFEPSPLSLVLQNIKFNRACPVAAALINGIVLGLGPIVPESVKDYTYAPKPLTFSFTPELPALPFFGHSIKPKLSETSRAFLVSGMLQAP
jgi:hypothetical protein